MSACRAAKTEERDSRSVADLDASCYVRKAIACGGNINHGQSACPTRDGTPEQQSERGNAEQLKMPPRGLMFKVRVFTLGPGQGFSISLISCTTHSSFFSTTGSEGESGEAGGEAGAEG